LRKPIVLIAGEFGSPHYGTRPHLEAAVRLTRKDAPVALYVGAANGDDPAFGAALCALLGAAGAADVLWPKPAKRSRDTAVARRSLERVDLVFVGGGDVEAGMAVLRRAQLVADLHAAAARGVVFAGMSAGAIMLGERWVRWPHDDATDDEAETYECLALAPISLDTHGEGDDWRETQSFAAVRAREQKRRARAYGIPSGGALIVSSSGKMRALGEPVPVFAAHPGRSATIERTLPAERT
jgi:cyanophycinase-like exopeptidase